jgi:hypothetical protein
MIMKILWGVVVVLILAAAALLIAPAAPAPKALALPPSRTAVVMPPTWTAAPFTTPSITPTSRMPKVVVQPPGVTSVPSLTPWKAERTLVIGETVQKRQLIVYRFGRGKHERLIVAGIHGADEFNTVTLAQGFIDYLNLHPQVIPAEVTLFILPALNADSSARGAVEDARLNLHGVDLNRNFPIGWKADWRSQGCSSLPGTGGLQAGSEPETQAVMRFILANKIEALVSYHSALLGVFPSGSPPDPGSVRLAQAIAGITTYAYPPVDTGCEYTGTLVDWAASVGVPAAVDVELNSPIEAELEINLKVLDLLLHWNSDL